MKKKFVVRKAAFMVAHEFMALIGLAISVFITWMLLDEWYSNLKAKINLNRAKKEQTVQQQVDDAVRVMNGQPPSYCTDEKAQEENDANATNGGGAAQDGSPGADDQTQEKVGGQ